jgi:cytochrome c peroxidase
MKRVALLLLLVACGDPPATQPDGAVDAPADAPVDASSEWPITLPLGFPPPRLPPGKPFTRELAELGRHLFYDKRLSGNGTQACASCHEQARAFTDGRQFPAGSTGTVLRRNSMSLTNIIYNPTQTWANHLLVTLEQQIAVPMFGTDPIELGITGNEEVVLERLRTDPQYQALFAAAFPGDTGAFDLTHVAEAITAFERTMISGNAPIDKHRRGEVQLGEAALRGEALFFSERFECHHCHGGFNFTIAVDHANLAEPGVAFFNTGLYNVGGDGSYPANDQGLRDVTFLDADRGRFRPPSLRNIALTAPYMHEGSMATLDEVLTFYERGGRAIETGPNAGDGKLSPYKSSFVAGFVLTPQERADMLAFLEALTDETFITDPALSDPFAQ